MLLDVGSILGIDEGMLLDVGPILGIDEGILLDVGLMLGADEGIPLLLGSALGVDDGMLLTVGGPILIPAKSISLDGLAVANSCVGAGLGSIDIVSSGAILSTFEKTALPSKEDVCFVVLASSKMFVSVRSVVVKTAVSPTVVEPPFFSSSSLGASAEPFGLSTSSPLSDISAPPSGVLITSSDVTSSGRQRFGNGSAPAISGWSFLCVLSPWSPT